jgi:hypothetical protein
MGYMYFYLFFFYLIIIVFYFNKQSYTMATLYSGVNICCMIPSNNTQSNNYHPDRNGKKKLSD